MQQIEELTVRAMEELDETALMDCVEKMRTQGADFHEIELLLQEGMHGVGRRFESGEYFLADLIVSGVLFQNVMERIQEEKKKSSAGEEILGTVLIGVMEGDIHDIGKDIVLQTLQAEGFRVIDLGMDVSAQQFLEAALEYHPDIIALSGVMGFCVDKMQSVIRLLEENGIRKKVKIVVGGNCVNHETSRMLGADGYSEDAVGNVALCKKIMEKQGDHD